jgi:hypothetical protein
MTALRESKNSLLSFTSIASPDKQKPIKILKYDKINSWVSRKEKAKR